jgi:nitroreductase
MEPDIKKIIEAGAKAPSGENAQPWQFKVVDNVIYQYLVPERDQSLYSWGHRASYVAHGAVLENIKIASSQFGYNTKIDLFPDKSDKNLLAKITLEKSSPKNEPLYPYIEKRVSNRKPYEIKPLTNEQHTALFAVSYEGAKFILTEDREKIAQLGRVGSTNEEIMLSNKKLHHFFFSHINWTLKEENEKRYGFYIKTLELPPPVQFIFKIFSKWSRMRIFNALGFPKVVAAQNAKVNAAASAICIITIKNRTPLDYINVGMYLQKLWLTASSHGLYIQPLAGLLFLKLRILEGDTSVFSIKQKNIIDEKYTLVQKLFGITDETVAFMFRVGVGDTPSAQSSKYDLNKILIT